MQTKVSQENSAESTLIAVDWERIKKLRVTQKIIDALKDLQVEGVFLTPANRRKDARKKYLGYGTSKMLLESESDFLLSDPGVLVKLISSNQQAYFDYREECGKAIEKATDQRESLVIEDRFGLIQIVSAIYVGEEVVGVLRAGGFLPGKMNDLLFAKLVDRFSSYGKFQGDIEKSVKSTLFFSSEKVAVVTNLISMLSQEVGAYLEETHRSTHTPKGEDTYNFHGLITKNQMILEIIRQIKLIGGSQSSVIIYGESGTGKELIAKLIHNHSKRKDLPFVTINCAALTETILEAELFGYKKGAFTGAQTDKKGLFEVADKGIIFLDEVGEMSLSLQVKILRLIQEGTFMRVGDTETRKVDVQVISATHRDLRQMIELGKFREDLYYRLAVVELTLPPLRDRHEDVPVLASHFLNEFQKRTNKTGITFSHEVIKMFQEYYWPGNVREIRNEVERLVALRSSHSMVKAKDLSKKFFYESYPEGLDINQEETEGFIKKLVDDYERNLLSKYLKKHKWNKTHVAKLCGITRQGLNKKVVKYRLDRRRM